MTTVEVGTRVTWTIAKEYARRLGGSLRNTGFGDHKLIFGSGDLRAEYFANDPVDALETARAMQGSSESMESAEKYLRQIGVEETAGL